MTLQLFGSLVLPAIRFQPPHRLNLRHASRDLLFMNGLALHCTLGSFGLIAPLGGFSPATHAFAHPNSTMITQNRPTDSAEINGTMCSATTSPAANPPAQQASLKCEGQGRRSEPSRHFSTVPEAAQCLKLSDSVPCRR